MPQSPPTARRDTPLAGAACRDVSPADSQFLYGYPHVQRMSEGVSDPLLASALYLNDGENAVLFISVDVIFLSKQHVAEARRRISSAVDISPDCILISATHTHSGPVTIPMLSNAEDATVPDPDSRYIERLVQGIGEAGIAAVRDRQPAHLGCSVKRVLGLGTNRHDPRGPSLPETPILVARSVATRLPIGVMCICAMHPTVLHEDNLLVSADFPGFARRYLRRQLSAPDLCVVHHMGAGGDQSPRHVARANTIAEAIRLGEILGQALKAGVDDAQWLDDWRVRCDIAFASLPTREFPSVSEAESTVRAAASRLEMLRNSAADRATVRTAECDWFGAQETLALARAQERNDVGPAAESCLPAEIQVISVGPWFLVAWPGEVFVEYAIELQHQFPSAHLITLANGDLQGYLVTAEAVSNQYYEASNALFASPEAPRILVDKTLQLLEHLSFRGPT